MQKFATMQILSARIAERPGEPLIRTAHRVAFNYEPRPGYLYVRSRMISSRCNDNFDEFPAQEIEKGYLSFIGKPVFVNHNNENHHRSRGVIIDVALHKDANRDGTPDTWVEGLMEIDALTFPKLASSIVRGDIARTSMGVDVAFSVCAACGNKATTPLEYCRHIPAQKGAKFIKRTASGEQRPDLIRERCHGLSFFENSLLVEDPADPTAYFLGPVERGPGLEHLGSRVQIPHEATRRFTPDLRDVEITRQQQMARTASRSPVSTPVQSRTARLSFTAAGRCPACLGQNTITATGQHLADCFDCESTWDLRTARLQDPSPQDPPVPDKHPDEMDGDEKKSWNATLKQHSMAWHARNPMHPDNIVEHWHAATPEEKENGKNWYADAHHGTRMLAESTKTPMHVAAGLVSNYSPQTHWATNIVSAAKVMRTKQAIGGPGNRDGHNGKGVMASASQKAKAQDMIDNHTHYNDLFSGPKTRAFAHLIEHGGDSPEDQAVGKSRVVVDRHAMSVACGARASDAAYGHSGLSGKKKYAEAEGHYHEAARQISAHEGEHISGHQVQAVTWLARQRLNEEHDRAMISGGSRQAGNAQHAIHQMSQYMGEHHPEMSLQMPGTGYSKREQGPTALEKNHYEDHKGQATGRPTQGSRRGRR